ncbi:NUDIX domain-containing protein [Paenibacillus sp. 1_12]|uniref:NUDIX hydrolase n=1 Tax=Paenibacillus sp. 1_12 TaxID=1566278 RepID=UPI0008E96A4E|nr:NUDIX hydrolase [Paenibacillus sp. 1_12]SFL42619.1 NUDIX domain-containing protein [Paenibacillus sp. 1_12]
MLEFITELPANTIIGGVHCVPVLDNGNLVMVWDREEKVLTTIGGRLAKDESIFDGLNREVMEEAGLVLSEEKTLFASWYWKEFDAYRLYYLAKVKEFVEIPSGFETTGYVIMNFRTAIDIIKKIEGREERIEVIRRAGILSGQLIENEQ